MDEKKTAGKAHAAGTAGALTPVLLWLLSLLTGAVEPPEETVVREALGVLALSAITGAAAWISAFFKRNHTVLKSVVLALACVSLMACAQDYGGITQVAYDAQSGDVEYISGKEAVAYDISFERDPDGRVKADVSASDVQAFEGQAIQAERIEAQTEAISGTIRELLPGLLREALCAAGVASSC